MNNSTQHLFIKKYETGYRIIFYIVASTTIA
jgi:hypothetical protein